MATGYNLPTYDYEADQQGILRKQKLAEAMLTGGLAPMGPTETAAGGVAIKKSPLEAIAKLLQVYMGGKMNQSIQSEQQALSERYRGDLRTGIEGLIDGLGATPGQHVPAQEGNNPSAYVAESTMTAGDAQAAKRKAILNAMASNHPMVQQIGGTMLGGLLKGEEPMTMKDYLALADKFDPASTVQAGRAKNPDLLKVKTEKPIEVGGMLLDPKTLKVLKADGEPPKQVTINGDLYEINPTTGQYKKLDNAPRITNNVRVPVNVVNQGETAFMKTLGEEGAKDLVKIKQEKHSALQTVSSMQKLEQLDNQGVFSGPTATPAMFMGSLAEAIGIPVDRVKLANSQAYQGEVLQNMQQYLTGSIARSTTNQDAEMLKAPLPQLLNSKEGRAALRRQVVAKARERIEYADSVQKQLETQFPEAGRLNSLTPGSQPLPPRGDVKPGGKPSVSNW